MTVRYRARAPRKSPGWRVRFSIARLVALGTLVSAPLLVVQISAAADACSVGSTCASVTVDASSALTNPTSGTISMTGLTPNHTYTLVDAVEGLPAITSGATHFYQGTYALNWSNCASGAASASTYTVGGNSATTGFASGIPPLTGGALPTITAGSSGSFSCGYSLTFTVGATSQVVQARNDVFAMAQDGPAEHVGSQAVGCPHLTPPPSVPEAPLPVLLPLIALAGFASAIWLDARRRPRHA